MEIRLCVFSATGVWLAFAGAVFAADPIDFNRDIRPLLSDRCYHCHGPDAEHREAGLRFDTEEGALAETDYGNHAIVAGDRHQSSMWERITSTDPDLKMPPPESGRKLSKTEIETLGRWIDAGAPWAKHWSFIAPSKTELPKTKFDEFVKNPIDRFVFARLEKEGLSPSAEADRESLIRRVTFDLTGLPPTLDEIDAFLADESPDAYEKVVDRLLRSPRYGEHMARYWLDAARYGDTHGLHLDNERSIWPYRDYVIDAFNNNKPFDEFTIEQVAGDLLPEPTLAQRIATGFNRCNVTTSEGGSIAEEYRVRYAIDRTETLGTVWMGLTVGCAVCHDHKYDPISQAEFYQLYAYYNSTADKAMDGNALLPPPSVRVPTKDQLNQIADLQAKITKIEHTLSSKAVNYPYQDPGPEADTSAEQLHEFVWIEDSLPSGAKPMGNSPWEFVSEPVFSGEKASKRSAKELSQHFFQDASPGLLIGENDTLFAYVYLDPKNPPQEIMLQFNDGSWDHRAVWGADKIDWGQKDTPSRRFFGELPEVGKWVRLEVKTQDVGLKPNSVIKGWAFTQFGGTVYWDKAGIISQNRQAGAGFASQAAWEQTVAARNYDGLTPDLTAALKTAPAQRSGPQNELVKAYFISEIYTKSRPEFEQLRTELKQTREQIAEIEKKAPSTLVMADQPQLRATFVLERGEYDKPNKDREVFPNVPSVLPALPEDAPKNRLAIAEWLVSDLHPLTGRVVVNRYWQRFFGTGLVKTAEDFGSQGDWPSHPQLLDWLAVEFRESGWNVKQMQKLIAMSHTYRQSSHATPDAFKRDPENRLLARGPRFRLDAEMLRDYALATSGLLVEQIGGASVKPYQPGGLWEAVGYTSSNTANFMQDSGNDLYRRSMYTFWKRTSPPPSMATFDAPTREACTVRRPRTNTPLQALVLMNDTQYVEAARHFGERIVKEGGESDEDRLTFGFRVTTGRHPKPRELDVLNTVLSRYRQQYEEETEAATKLLAVGDSPATTTDNPAEQAAWTMIGSLLMNLDEAITKG